MLVIAFLAGCGGTEEAVDGPGLKSYGELMSLNEDANTALMECALAKGLPAEWRGGGVFIPGDSRDNELMSECTAEVWGDPRFVELASPSRETLRIQFEHNESVHACLVSAGYPSDPPPDSFDVWLLEGMAWGPLGQLALSDPERMRDAARECGTYREFVDGGP